ncbi:MAG: type IV pilus secretin PilQ [Syntrophales bacterium]|nr:type IV pilus secretin PilQ [Syntrophales bacterium]
MRGNRAFKVFLVGFAMFMGSLSGMVGTVYLWAADPVKSDIPAPQALNVGYLENVALENPMPGKERIIIRVSRLSAASVESQAGNSLLVKLDNMFVPQDFRRPLGEGTLNNILRVLPVQRVLEGKQWAYVTIDLRERVPHSVRQEGQNVLIDFNVAGLSGKTTPAVQKPPPSSETVTSSERQKDKAAAGETAGEAKNYAGHKISLDFQDANIKSVLRLLSELANVNIVSGDDVKGNMSIQMKAVPWDQALDTILSITGLAKKQTGNIITVMTLEKMKKDDADRLATLEAQRKVDAERANPAEEPLVTRVVSIDYADAKKLTENILDLLPKDKDGKVKGSVKVDEHSNAMIIQATRQDMTRLFPIIEKIDKPIPQILIKANIVQTSKETARNLGIQWGGMWGQKIGSQGLYVTPGGVGGSAAAPGSAFSGAYNPTSGVAGISGQGFGVNFPASMSGAASASLGLMFGTIGENILELQLSALQTDGKVNILSSPSLTTLDNQKAYTESGKRIPYSTLESSGGTITKSVKFVDAVLRLEITPHVIDGKSLKMKILVQKDEIGPYVAENPVIFKKQTETSLIVQDGETIVISGLSEQKNNNTTSGVPWLKDIPGLGWMFKGEGKSESMEETLIFITPTILKPQAVAGIQEGP